MKPLLIMKELTFERGGQIRKFLVKSEVRESKLTYALYERIDGQLYIADLYSTMQKGEDAAKRTALHTTWHGHRGP